MAWWCSQAQTGGTDLGKEDHRGKVLFPSRYIEGTDYQHDIAIAVDLKHLPKVVLVRVLHYKITLWFFFLTSFSYFTLWKKVTTWGSPLRSGELCSISVRREHLQKLFGILHKSFISSLFFIHSFNNLAIAVWTREYFFYTLGPHPILLYLVCHSNWGLFQWAPVSLWWTPSLYVYALPLKTASNPRRDTSLFSKSQLCTVHFLHREILCP